MFFESYLEIASGDSASSSALILNGYEWNHVQQKQSFEVTDKTTVTQLRIHVHTKQFILGLVADSYYKQRMKYFSEVLRGIEFKDGAGNPIQAKG